MREIKFRVRDLEENKFVDLQDAIITFDNCGIEIYKEDGFVLIDYEINQYTGLKDTDGKEVYEGDILQIEDSICVVEYRNFGFGAREIKSNEFYLFGEDEAISIYVTKVRGNIYENKELLEVN